ncbi:protein-methionine sulfoxide oxidase mical2b isoform X1 [Cyprinus carpio]|uniref:F-actin monooxygenase n=1 Tax=Cyprinus carpio TaxID=7962 RepID=A0A9Q9XXA4_CYPCA|nr:protein-methionine sulfoxide oxidase mical2b isoform X1 [Cyprinus carpio]XP_042609646.1 protein-methionine sulfoxide oxidase mical2b isoform X1 [Cyprinus carpio]XP_042609648.1 protein-methionine sulfoxide oxidase mical2b isoform X1 [Cyprinus carpio]
MGETEDERTSQAGQLFENFVQATTCKGTLQAFSVLCRQLELNPSDYRGFYSSLKAAVTYWKVKGLWGKLDKRASHKEYSKGKACADTRCLIIGGGPCGFRTAIELALLGAKVVVIEKRDTFSRNNVLHLWPYTIQDLRDLGAKKFYGKFCAGSIDHISIRQLQLMLLKISLIVGVEVHVNVEFAKLLEPPEDKGTDGPGWRVEVRPADHTVSEYEFDVIIGADGRRSTLDGFKRKEFRGKLAIAITANFVNRNTTAEAKVEEISGVAFIFNQKFFLELKEETGIDLENIVYYKDNTHYFVMTAKKQSLLDKGVIINDYIETERLLASNNVNQEALLSYAREAADFGTNYQLPSLDYAINHYGQPDVAMFDFTCMYASENAALVREKNGHQLLVALVGDSLLEPFWPMGTGCARGFLAAFDTAWMIKGWAQGKGPLDLLSERESIYRLLPQTTAENISKNFEQYTIDPATRYPNLNSSCVRPHQVRHLYINGEQDLSSLEHSGPTRRSVNISRRESEVRPSRLLLWCEKQTQGYRGVDVTDLTTSWRSGLALCALIHRQRPDLIDFDSLNEADCAKNNQLAFDVAEREFGIQPVTTGKEMNGERGPDKLIMVLYLSKFYEMFHNSPQSVTGVPKETDANNEDYSSKTTNSLYHSLNHALPRKRIPKVDKKLEDNDNKKRKKASSHLEELMSNQSAPPVGEREEQKENKVRSMATQLLARFEENAPSCGVRRQSESEADKPVSLDMTENLRFAKPKSQPSPPPPKPKWQPSPYLRLLESHTQNETHHSDRCIEIQSSHSHTEIQSNYKTTSVHHTLQLTGIPSSYQISESRPRSPHIPFKVLQPADPSDSALGGMLQCLQKLEEEVCQRKVQSEITRQFNKKSIKERAQQLSSLFTGKPPKPQADESSAAVSSSPSKAFSFHTIPESSSLSCRLSPVPSVQHQQCSEDSETQLKHDKHTDRSEIRRVECLDPSKQRTVGKVSSAIGVKAATLAILYETDHRPNNPLTLSLTSMRKEFPRGLGGSDTCHFCKKRVYIMERLSAEGYFFHRECFRCNICGCTLRLGGHAFDSNQGTFYCKLHFSQRKISSRHRRGEINGAGRPSSSASSDYTTTDGLRGLSSDPAGAESDSRSQNDPKGLSKPSTPAESAEVQALSDSTEVINMSEVKDSSKKPDPADPAPVCPDSPLQKALKRSTAKGEITNKNNLWRKKIRSTLPLVLIKKFHHGKPDDKTEALAEEDGDSDFEEIHESLSPTKTATSTIESGCPLMEDRKATPIEQIPKIPLYRAHFLPESTKPSTSSPEPVITADPSEANSLSPKKKLTLSLSEKEKLLNWDLAAPGEPSTSGEEQRDRTSASPANDQPAPEAPPKPSRPQPEPTPPLLGFQQWANSLRKSFSSSKKGNNPVVLRRNRPLKARPLSEGSFNLSGLLGSSIQSSRDEEHSNTSTDDSQSRVRTESELSTLLEQVALSSKTHKGTKDDMASLPPRKLNFFSSLRIKRNEGADQRKGDNQKDILTILSRFRSKASAQQQQQESNSSSEEEQEPNSQRTHSGTSQKKTAVQQTKRDQLKRLHRAQVIQRQLEEVEEKQRALEEKGVALEKILRGETGDDSTDETTLLQTWFKLVLEKNKLSRYESELMIFAQELELEDTQSRLQQDLRRRMATEDCEKSASELTEEQSLLVEIMKVVENRDKLVSLLEEQRLKEKAEDRDLESMILSRGYRFHWT